MFKTSGRLHQRMSVGSLRRFQCAPGETSEPLLTPATIRRAFQILDDQAKPPVVIVYGPHLPWNHPTAKQWRREKGQRHTAQDQARLKAA